MSLYETLKAAKLGAAPDVLTKLRAQIAPFAKKEDEPSNYQELEYIQNNGTQYIDTGLISTDLIGCEIEITMRNDRVTTTEYNFNGSYLSGSSAQFGLVATSSTECRASINFTFSAAISVTQLALSEYHTIYVTNGLQKVDNVEVGTEEFGALNSQKFLLFARTNSSDSNITICPAMSFKSFKVKKNGKFIRNLIPAKRKSDKAIGLYDLANDVFYTNQGTGDFIAGPYVS